MTALCEGRVGLKGSDGGDGLMSWKGEWLGGGRRGGCYYTYMYRMYCFRTAVA